MNDPAWHRAGGCRCGRMRFETTAAPLITMACHCTGCRRMSSSAFSLSALFPADAFRVTQGEPVIGGLHGATRHYFCGWCLSWMFTRPEGLEGFVNLRPTMLDDARGCAPFVETMRREKLAWVETPAVHRFDGFPPMDEFAALLEAYRAWRPPA
jgi:hypothetical protein